MKTRVIALTSAIALAAVMAVPVVAQDEMAGPEPFADDAKPYVPIVSKGFQHQFWQAVRMGAEDKAAELNMDVNFIGPENESQVDKQMEMLQAEYDKGPAALCFAALDSVAANPLLEQMDADGIPIIAFDSGVDSDIPITTAATDNVAAAELAAEKMAELIGGAGKVGVIVHDQTSRTGIDRSEGFVNRMAEAYPDIEIVGPEYGGGDQLKSTDLAKGMIAGQPGHRRLLRRQRGLRDRRRQRRQRARPMTTSWSSAMTPASSRSTPSRTAPWPARSSRTRSASAPSASRLPRWPFRAWTCPR